VKLRRNGFPVRNESRQESLFENSSVVRGTARLFGRPLLGAIGAANVGEASMPCRDLKTQLRKSIRCLSAETERQRGTIRSVSNMCLRFVLL